VLHHPRVGAERDVQGAFGCLEGSSGDGLPRGDDLVSRLVRLGLTEITGNATTRRFRYDSYVRPCVRLCTG
jgi:hypothetical protein